MDAEPVYGDDKAEEEDQDNEGTETVESLTEDLPNGRRRRVHAISPRSVRKQHPRQREKQSRVSLTENVSIPFPLWLGCQIPKFLHSQEEDMPPPFRKEFRDE